MCHYIHVQCQNSSFLTQNSSVQDQTILQVQDKHSFMCKVHAAFPYTEKVRFQNQDTAFFHIQGQSSCSSSALSSRKDQVQGSALLHTQGQSSC